MLYWILWFKTFRYVFKYIVIFGGAQKHFFIFQFQAKPFSEIPSAFHSKQQFIRNMSSGCQNTHENVSKYHPLYASGNATLVLHQKQNTFASFSKSQMYSLHFIKEWNPSLNSQTPTVICQCSFYVLAPHIKQNYKCAKPVWDKSHKKPKWIRFLFPLSFSQSF